MRHTKHYTLFNSLCSPMTLHIKHSDSIQQWEHSLLFTQYSMTFPEPNLFSGHFCNPAKFKFRENSSS